MSEGLAFSGQLGCSSCGLWPHRHMGHVMPCRAVSLQPALSPAQSSERKDVSILGGEQLYLKRCSENIHARKLGCESRLLYFQVLSTPPAQAEAEAVVAARPRAPRSYDLRGPINDPQQRSTTSSPDMAAWPRRYGTRQDS